MSKSKKIIIIVLCLVEILSIHLTYKAFRSKPTILDDVEYNTIDKNTFGIFIEKDSYSSESDKYEEYSGTTWPSGYELNAANSMCFDNDGVAIPNPLSFNSGTITITTSNTAYCYLYFDKESAGMTGIELVASNPSNMSSSLVGGLYRYQGTHDVVDNNYICFGTDNESTCTGDTDHYMYRIIGVNSSGQIEVIKEENLNNVPYVWYNDATAYNIDSNKKMQLTLLNAEEGGNKVNLLGGQMPSEPGMDVYKEWPDSFVYSGINGSLYLTDTNFVPTSPINWQNKIATVSWKYGSADPQIYDGDTYYNVYTGWSGVISAKVSIMYPHDYLYAYGSSSPGTAQNASLAWINYYWYTSVLSSTEFLNATYSSSPNYGVIVYFYDGYIYQTSAYLDNCFVRPVFYLESTVTIIGSGTINHPYIINN